MTTILAPIDHSPISAAVVARAAELARATQGRVVLLTVMVPPVFLAEYAPPPEMLRRITVGNEKAVQSRFAGFAAALARDAVPAQSIVLRGSPAGCILAHARRRKADYIVMGSHGHTAFYDLIAGSTTYAVLRGAPCPVVVIPPPRARTRSA